jgi:predicted acetyltransferase
MSPRTTRLPVIRYRPARRTDVETLAELGSRTYRVASVEKRREFYTDHPRFTLRDVRVIELEGEVVASLVLYPFEAYVRGQRVPVTGVGSVAVSPEHRRRGVGEAAMRAALRELRQRGSHLSMLYPFRGSYYRKLGYGVVEYLFQLAVAASNLPLADESRRVRRLMLPDRAAVQALYERVAEQGHFALVRRDDWWTRRLWTYPGDWVVYEGRRRGQIEGYLYYEVENSRGPFRLGDRRRAHRTHRRQGRRPAGWSDTWRRCATRWRRSTTPQQSTQVGPPCPAPRRTSGRAPRSGLSTTPVASPPGR